MKNINVILILSILLIVMSCLSMIIESHITSEANRVIKELQTNTLIITQGGDTLYVMEKPKL